MSIPSDTIHTWWTGDDQGSTFRVTMTPCFDGFHEGLELVSNLVAGTGKEQAGTFPPFDQWSFINKTRLHAILWTMMATELDSGYGVGYILGIVFGKIASLPSNVEMASALRQEFLPHLAQKASDDKQEEATVDKGDEL